MTGQLSIFDVLPKSCDCGSTNLYDAKTKIGSSTTYLHKVKCKDCGKMSGQGGAYKGWISNRKTWLEAVKDWNENERVTPAFPERYKKAVN